MLKTIEWRDGVIRLIDQIQLPHKIVYEDITTTEALWQAIKQLKVRGAPALGVAAALGVAQAMMQCAGSDRAAFDSRLGEVCDYLATSRPTAVNLFWALERMRAIATAVPTATVDELKAQLIDEALAIITEDQSSCRAIGHCGAELIADGMNILTHCNAGSLATYDYGTALGVFYAAHEAGKKFTVYVPETRPLLQGARLTNWELRQAGIDCVLICDSMAAMLMQQGKIDMAITGADRIAVNGDTANKIGTYMHAVCAAYHTIPFYIAAPASTFDLSLASGAEIPIEERAADEVRCFGKILTALSDSRVYNPAFDVTPAELIAGFMTDCGLVRPPYAASFQKLRGKDRSAK